MNRKQQIEILGRPQNKIEFYIGAKLRNADTWYNKGEKDYPVTFAGLTKRDGSFIVSRENIENFTLDDLKGKYIIGGRKGGMPVMTLEYTLKQHGINTKTELTIDTSIAFNAMSGAFISGTGDFVTLFEPNVTILKL